MFPMIVDIQDVLPAIKDRDGFILIDKGAYSVIDYVIENFPKLDEPFGDILRECRGITFRNSDGRIVRRPLRKFFNYGQGPDPLKLDLHEPHVILEKVDGSLLSPFLIGDGLLWGTRKGETEVSAMTTEFLKNNPQYEEFSRELCESEWTPCFEFMSRKNRIVIDYGKEDRMVLLAIRDMYTGDYMSYGCMSRIAQANDIEVVKTLDSSYMSMEALSTDVKNMTGIEGYVVAFDDGIRIKLKCEEYCFAHRVKDSISDERAVIGLILTSGLDDCYSFLSDADVERIETFEGQFIEALTDAYTNLRLLYDLMKSRQKEDLDRKTFALSWVPNYKDFERVILFQCWDKEVGKLEMYGMLQDFVKKSLTDTKKYAKIKADIGWGDY